METPELPPAASSPAPSLVGPPAAANSMSAGWCAAREAEIRQWVNDPAAVPVPIRTLRTWLIELLSQLENPPAPAVGPPADLALPEGVVRMPDEQRAELKKLAALLYAHRYGASDRAWRDYRALVTPPVALGTLAYVEALELRAKQDHEYYTWLEGQVERGKANLQLAYAESEKRGQQANRAAAALQEARREIERLTAPAVGPGLLSAERLAEIRSADGFIGNTLGLDHPQAAHDRRVLLAHIDAQDRTLLATTGPFATTFSKPYQDLQQQYYAMKQRAQGAEADLAHYNKVLAHANGPGADLTHAQVADKVRMLTRSDLDHEMLVVMARDRIIALAEELRAATSRVGEAEARAEKAEANHTLVCDLLTDARKYHEEVEARAEGLRKRLWNALDALGGMYCQYTPGRFGHDFMSAGEDAQQVLDHEQLLDKEDNFSGMPGYSEFENPMPAASATPSSGVAEPADGPCSWAATCQPGDAAHCGPCPKQDGSEGATCAAPTLVAEPTPAPRPKRTIQHNEAIPPETLAQAQAAVAKHMAGNPYANPELAQQVRQQAHDIGYGTRKGRNPMAVRATGGGKAAGEEGGRNA